MRQLLRITAEPGWPVSEASEPGVFASVADQVLTCRSVLDPQGPIGAAEKTILLNSLFIMLAIVVPTIIATIGFAWWFRASNTRAHFQPTWAYSGRVELVVWSIPSLVVLFLGGIIWISSYDLHPSRPPSAAAALDVEVVALDWKWLFIYPEQSVGSVNELVVPVGRPLHFSLTSASVMNAFFIPQLGSMVYVMNGMRSQLYLQADREGNYYGRSAHFSGDGFPGMQFTVRAVAPAAFDDWISETRRTGRTLDNDVYAQLSKQSRDVQPIIYGSVDPKLFDAITTQAIAPAAGPTAGRPTPDVSARPGG